MPDAHVPVRMLVLDIDGTLLRPDKTLSPLVGDVVRRAANQVTTILATARPPRSVRSIYDELALRTHQVNYNGALIWDPLSSSVIQHVPLMPELCASLMTRTRSILPNSVISIEHLDRWYTDRVDERFTTETGKLFSPDFVEPLDRLATIGATKLMFHADPQQIDLLRVLLEQEFCADVRFIRTDPDLLQMMNRSTSKWLGVLSIARHVGIDASSILAIGDNENDIDMIRESGFGIAMSNACQGAKDVAKWVAPSNADDGVAVAIERFLFQRE